MGSQPAAGIAKNIANDTGSGFGFSTGTSFAQFAEDGEYVPNASSCKEFAYAEHKNQRFRPQMEDSKYIKT